MEKDKLLVTPVKVTADLENQIRPSVDSDDDTSEISVASVKYSHNNEKLINENKLLKQQLDTIHNLNQLQEEYDGDVIRSRMFTPIEFEELKKEFAIKSINNQISLKNLRLLLEEKSTLTDYHSDFVDQYIYNLNTDYFTFLDYYSIVNHLRNLYEIKSKKVIEIVNERYDKSYDRKRNELNLSKLYDELERNKEEFHINRQKDILKKEQQFIENRQIYEDKIMLYDKDTYGITWKGCFKNMFKCLYNESMIKDFDKIYEIIKGLPTLNNYEKNLILIRFQTIATYCLKHYNTISRWYNSTQLFIIACSIINPALLSINSDKDNLHYYTIFWSVWVSQLLVSLTTSYISFFKWDKKYFLFNGYKTKINQEIWLFIELSGSHYADENILDNNHSKQLNKFLNRLESLYKKLKLSEFEIETTNNDEEGTKENPKKQMVEEILMARQRKEDVDRKRKNENISVNDVDTTSELEP